MKKLYFVLTLMLSSLSMMGGNKFSFSPVSIKAGESATVTVYLELTTSDIKTIDLSFILPDGLYIPKAGSENTEGDPATSFDIDVTWNEQFYQSGKAPGFIFAVWDADYGEYHLGNYYTDGGATDGFYQPQTTKTWCCTFKVCAKDDASTGDIKITYVNIADADGAQNQDASMNVDADPIKIGEATVGEYAATFKSTGSTICAESALDFSAVSGAKLYAVSEITSTSAKLTEVEDGIADANKGYLVMGLSGDQKIPFTDGSSSYSGDNKLVGVTAPTAIASDAKIYVLSDGEFHPCSGGTLAAGKAYLNCSGIEGLAKSITFSFVETTGIRNISSDEDASNTPIYNLSGMRVKKAQKGVYIRNGKKYVVE
jgi:hypothetical protein